MASCATSSAAFVSAKRRASGRTFYCLATRGPNILVNGNPIGLAETEKSSTTRPSLCGHECALEVAHDATELLHQRGLLGPDQGDKLLVTGTAAARLDACRQESEGPGVTTTQLAP